MEIIGYLIGLIIYVIIFLICNLFIGNIISSILCRYSQRKEKFISLNCMICKNKCEIYKKKRGVK